MTHKSANATSAPDKIQPRLSISQLLFWTACIAALLALERLEQSVVDPWGLPDRYTSTASTCSAVAIATSLTGIMILVVTRRPGLSVLRHPGHWLMLLSACEGLVIVPILANTACGRPLAAELIYMTCYGLVCIVATFAFINSRPWVWRLVFLMSAASAGLVCIFLLTITTNVWNWSYWPLTLRPLLATLLSVLLMVVMMSEWLTGTRRDWLHYVGVIETIACAAVPLLYRLADV